MELSTEVMNLMVNVLIRRTNHVVQITTRIFHLSMNLVELNLHVEVIRSERKSTRNNPSNSSHVEIHTEPFFVLIKKEIVILLGFSDSLEPVIIPHTVRGIIPFPKDSPHGCNLILQDFIFLNQFGTRSFLLLCHGYILLHRSLLVKSQFLKVV